MLTVFLLSFILAPEAEANPGDLDTTLGIGGKVTTDFTGSYNWAEDLAIQADGKIVAAGYAVIGGGWDGGEESGTT